ncbi:MAG: sulfatase-like hydrolase/transferase [Rikenellaceae bacterium]
MNLVRPFASALSLSLLSFTVAANTKPNVIVILADDMGYADTGFTGAKDILTPNLDALASEGVVFTHGYANHAFSGPSRAALMTGRYQHRFGFETNPAYDPANPYLGMPQDETLFPARMQQVGYKTGVIGKWHLGASENHHPLNRGFDYFYGFLGGGHDYFRIDMTKPVWEAYLQPLQRNKMPATFDGYLTTALSRDAVNFINENKDDPFMLYLAYNAPHAPQQAPAEDIARYAHIEDKKRRTYAAMVDVMDRGIGEVVEALKKSGIYENTVIFFMSDNGGPQPSESSPGSWNGSCNEPFRGGKGSMYDGGIHVPFMMCWAGGVKGGIKYEYPVNSLDIGRTAVELAGGDPDSGKGMEGVNLVPFVKKEVKGAPHEAIFWRSGGNYAALASDKMKYVKDRESKTPQLFYIAKDAGESNDLSAKSESKVAQLKSAWEGWNSGNIPCSILGYKDYHKKRDAFYQTAVPKEYLKK